jgi:hypothetical protein
MFQPQDVRELLELGDDDTLTLYLTVDNAAPENQAANPAWRTSAKDILRDLDKGLSTEKRSLFRDIRARIESDLEHYQPASKGLALFYTTQSEKTLQLPFPVDNKAAFGKPFITPLLRAMDEYKAYLVVMVDHEKARLITGYLCSADEQETVKLDLDTSDWTHKTFQPTSNFSSKTVQSNAHDSYEQRIEVYQERFHEDVAKRAAQIVGELSARYIVIGGDEQAAHAVQRLLPEKVAQMVIAVKALPMRYRSHEVVQHVLPLVLDYARQQELALVNQVIDAAKAGGRGRVGREAVLHALNA